MTKSLCFFNGKGGVGKTTLTVLFASYLQYARGKRVVVLDLEAGQFPVSEARERDRVMLGSPDSALAVYLKEKGLTVKKGGVFDIVKMEAGEKESDVDAIRRFYTYAYELKQSGKYDYVLVDFPAQFQRISPQSIFLASGLIDLCVIPTDVSRASMRWAKTVAGSLKGKADTAVLWNNLSWYDNTGGVADKLSVYFTADGIDVVPFKVKTFAKARRDSGVKYFVLNTVCWPEDNVRRANVCLEEAFSWLEDRVDKAGGKGSKKR